ncbi:MAG TPA: dicarboxylate/amino acid:cation symporter [Polyangiaceae bacterium]|nr:dicarboxylate/amino acid:cation symporter [Polyangiaceae bacterium]
MRKQAALRLLVALAIGSGLGLAANAFAGQAAWLDVCVHYVAEPIGKVFIRLLLMLVIPVMFSALVMGIAELELAHLGRLGLRTLGYTALVSSVAVLVGLALVNVLQPGSGVSRELLGTARSAVEAAPIPKSTSAVDLLIGVVPNNPVAAAATGDMLAWLFFSIFFGVGLALTQGPKAEALRQMIGGLFEVCMKLMDLVLKLAPLGVGALMFAMTARVGLGVLLQLGAYVGVVVLGLGFHMFVVYGAGVLWLGGRSPVGFFRDIRLALVTAFSTASSNATLPTALRVAEENLHLPTHVSRFVLTAGATMNQNGTALFEGVTVLFLAQAYGVDLDLTQQAIVMLICILAGIGTAGVPAGSLPVIAMILTLLGVPAEGIGLVLGVDRFLDMCRTTVNVAGDLAVATLVAKGEPTPERADEAPQGAPRAGA